jgi:hypothetical protein
MDRRVDFHARFPAIRRVLLDQWDPAGVRDEPDAHDEYDGYALALYGLLARGATDDDLAEYLAEVSMVWLGLGKSTAHSLRSVIAALRGIGIDPRERKIADEQSRNDERGAR